MRRLSHQIHLTVVAVLLLFALLVSVAFWFGPEERGEQRLVAGLEETFAELLPNSGAPPAQQQAALERLAGRLTLDLALFAADGRRLAAAGGPLSAPNPGRSGSRWLHTRGRGFAMALRLPDGRTLVARRRPARAHLYTFLVTALILGVAVALGAWPVTRRLTRRLERLRARVEDLGGGDLGARAPVEGRDEVADLARSFNRAAERIQALVAAQRRTLAFASHELRSPLARLRVALEMLPGDPERKAAAARDVEELDGLIGELLEKSRLETKAAVRSEELDLLALVAEEAARYDLEAEGDPASVKGDPRLLRRLLRNLLENARRHGGGAARVRVDRLGDGGVRLRVGGPRSGRARLRTRTDLRALLPASGQLRDRRGLRPGPCPGAPDRPGPRGRRTLRPPRGRGHGVRGHDRNSGPGQLRAPAPGQREPGRRSWVARRWLARPPSCNACTVSTTGANLERSSGV